MSENIENKEEILHKQTNSHQTSNPFTIEENKNNKFSFSMPSYIFNRFTSNIEKFNNLKLDESSLNEWKDIVQESVEFYTSNNLYNSLFENEDKKFEQGFHDNTGNLMTIDNFKLKAIDGEIKGELALLKVAKHLGLGEIVRVPLPHSGLWVTIKPPTEKDLIDFYNNIYKSKISLGRSTSGLTLSNFSVYLNNSLLDFIIAHIHSVNYLDIKPSEIKKYLSIHDIPILAWGLACTIYPNGYNYKSACIEDIEKCTHITEGIISLPKLLWIDNSSLSESQRVILSEFRPNKLTIDSYNKYKSEHISLADSYFTTKTGIKVSLTVPTAEQYIDDGLLWINTINNKIETIALDDNDKVNKEEILTQYVKTSLLKQYNHFVSSIEIDDNIITDKATINSILELLSSDDELRPFIIEEINKFITKTTIAIIGIPEYECPVCKANQNPDPINDKFVNVIPLDSMNLFFSLITLRISTILEREI